MSQPGEIDLACSLSSRELSARRDELRRGLFAEAEEIRDVPGGCAIRFAWSAERIRRLGDFVAFESDCCAFMSLGLDVERGQGDVWLRLVGPPEAESLIRSGVREVLPGGRMHGAPAEAGSSAAGDGRVPVGSSARGDGPALVGPSALDDGRALVRGGAGLVAAGGAAALVCCAAPLLAAVGVGIAAVRAPAALDLGAAAALVLGAVLWTSGRLRRRRAARSAACGC